jgi:hypothetical protein
MPSILLKRAALNFGRSVVDRLKADGFDPMQMAGAA